GKVFVPFNSSIQVSAKQLVLSGYYPDFNLAISNLPQHGFGTINGWNANATTQLKPAAALSAATGLSFPLAPGTRLYAGVYVDYGLTGLKEKNDSMPLVAYSPTGLTGVKAGSVLNSPNAGKVDLLSFGIQLRLSFGSARSKSAGRSNTTQEPQQTKQDSINDDEYEVLERSVLFGQVGDTVIPDIQKKHLDDLADVLLRHSRIRIALAGHICSSDVEKEDDKVGAARVESVAQYLQSKGIDRGRLDISPVIENHAFEPLDLLANFQNRRVAITVK
ncbi:MAG TPA: OmpA family protein, partial [Puia sp.]|nr:OmpA family protein [Puia sp.]